MKKPTNLYLSAMWQHCIVAKGGRQQEADGCLLGWGNEVNGRLVERWKWDGQRHIAQKWMMEGWWRQWEDVSTLKNYTTKEDYSL